MNDATHTPSPEFDPDAAQRAIEAFDRRTFLKLMGAGFAAAGLSQLGACSKPQPSEKIVPYVRSPEYVVPGLPAYYASTLPTRGFASGFGRGVIVESHEGRPTKIEGNALHPSSLGATDIFMQASVLQLYDPDRSKTPMHEGQPIAWEQFFRSFNDTIATHGGPGKIRIALLTSTITSPTLAAQIDALRNRFPFLRWFVDDSLDSGNQRVGLHSAAGRRLTPLYNFSKARRIVSLDAHFLADPPGALAHARNYAATRRDTADMSRLYVAECTSTFTGAVADHRLAIAPSQMPQLASEFMSQLLGKPVSSSLPANAKRWIAAAASDLLQSRGSSLVLAGEYQPPEVHAAVYAINHLLNAPVDYLEPVDVLPDTDFSLAALMSAMHANEIDLLLTLDVNPAYTAPAFSEALQQFARNRPTIHAGAYADETAHLCAYHLPLSHPLESWSDLRAHDGTASIVQPLIEPLWNTKSAIEILAALATPNAATGYELVRKQWPDNWRKNLRDGIIAGTHSSRITDLPAPDAQKILNALSALAHTSSDAIELAFRPDPTIADGFYANHPWLQELPKPLTRLTWGNAALVSPATAAKLGIEQPADPSRKQMPTLRIQANGQSVELPAWVLPGHPDNTITLHLGGGRTFPEDSVQQSIGVNVNSLRPVLSLWHTTAEIQRTNQTQLVACVQATQSTEDRDMARSRSVRDISPPAKISTHLSLYQEYAYPGYKWGMVIDLSTCIGCSACVVACQAENNIPAVGREQVYLGREMHWLRIDTYHAQDAALSTRTSFQPMLCQHCENAPCEVVCPVEATSHSDEGINEMTYNRCVGTRYCSNNCPYKVRRFNFLHFTAITDDNPEQLQHNPNVTVRSRGVMEKCTYCIQRINRARIDAKREWARSVTSPDLHPAPPMRNTVEQNDPLPRLAVITACQQACPTQAITFGDLNDASALVTKLKKSPLNYSVLEELNTVPRTTYLERVTNPHPSLEGGAA